MKRLEDKTVLITGGGGAIGKTAAAKALSEGAKVMLVDLDNDALASAKKELNGNGNLATHQANVTNYEEVEGYVDATMKEFGSIDVFFNNAGYPKSILVCIW